MVSLLVMAQRHFRSAGGGRVPQRRSLRGGGGGFNHPCRVLSRTPPATTESHATPRTVRDGAAVVPPARLSRRAGRCRRGDSNGCAQERSAAPHARGKRAK